MPTLGEIRGQSRAIEILRTAIETERVHHAYLFTGPPRAGKFTTARAFAAALNCEAKEPLGCGTCGPCTRIDGDIHPDVIELRRKGAAQMIPIDAIRAQVIPALALPPHEASARVFLVEEATSLAGPAANALLKSLEEPPPRTHFVLCTQAPEKLLPTIRSRCQRVAFAGLPLELTGEILGEDEHGKRVTLSDELSRVAEGGSMEAVLDVAARVSAQKDDVAAVLVGFAEKCTDRAREELAAGRNARAKTYAKWAREALSSEVSVTLHNANKQLAVEQLLVRVRRAPLPLGEQSP